MASLAKINQCICNLQSQIDEIEVSQGIQSIVAGDNITVDDADPLNPIVSSTGGGGDVCILADIDTTDTRILGEGDECLTIVFTEDDPVSVEIPDDDTYDFAIGTLISIVQGGGGLVTISGEDSAEVNGQASVDTMGQHTGILLVKISANNWIAVGGI